MDYDGDLRLLKRSFSGGGEGPFYFRMLELLAARHHLDWLDIGIGRDGAALQPFIAACRARGQTLSITGIDPDAEPAHREEDGVRWRLVRSTFQTWTDEGLYDVINADQSLYYLGDLRTAIRRMSTLLRPGGVFIATCWSCQDTLRQLHMRLLPGADGEVTGEYLTALLRELPDLSVVETAEFKTGVRLRTWLEDTRYLEPALRVIARRPLDPTVDPAPEVLRSLLEEFPDVAQRVNVAVCAIRPEIRLS